MVGLPDAPGPTRDVYNAPYWDGLADHRLVMPRCEQCGHVLFPMRPVCTQCFSDSLQWVELSGRGTVWGYCVYHHAFHPAFVEQLPYNVSMIELEEGPMLVSNVVGVALEALNTGLCVAAFFDDREDGATLLRFRAVSDA